MAKIMFWLCVVAIPINFLSFALAPNPLSVISAFLCLLGAWFNYEAIQGSNGGVRNNN